MKPICFQNRYLCYKISPEGQNIEFSSIDTKKKRVVYGSCAKIINMDRSEVLPSKVEFSNNVLTVVFADNTILEILVVQQEYYFTFTVQSVSRTDFLEVVFVNIQLEDESEEFCGSLVGMTLSTKMCEHPGNNHMMIASAYPHIGIFSTVRSPYPAKAAVIGAPKDLLRMIQRQVLDEIPDGELPKSYKGGPYADRVVEDARGSYSLLMETVTMDKMDELIADLKRFHINQVNLHHSRHYIQGEFCCMEQHFPNGMADFKKLVDRFHQNGILVGIHPYSFFLSTKSIYVTPIPHKDLDILREFSLQEPLDAEAMEVKVCENTDGVTPEVGYLAVNSPYLWIDDEIVKFSAVEDGKFGICERGAYGTVKAAHSKGARVRQLKEYFFLPMAKAGSPLFYEIARNTARFYNESGADMFYMDALDGAFVLEGNDYVWYHAIDFLREMFAYLERDPIFECCYNPQYTGSWFVRSRYGAMDESLNSHRQFFDAHTKYNCETAEPMGVTPVLGWVNLYPKTVDPEKSWQLEPIYEEDLEYLCAKAIATDASLAFFENFRKYPNLPCTQEYLNILQKYALFKKTSTATDATRRYLKEPNHAAYLEDGTLYQASYSTSFVEHSGDEFQVNNPFAEQKAWFRMEALCAAGDYDSPEAITLCDFSEDLPIQNQSIRFERPFSSGGNRGLGVWCYGDGSGAIVCIKLRNLSANQQRSGEHFIRVSFVGWRYFAFYENQNGSMPVEEWPRTDVTYSTYNDLQKFYGHYRVKLDYNKIDGVDVCIKGSDNIRLKPIRLIPHITPVWKNPTIKLGDSVITVFTDLHADTDLVYDGESCIVMDKSGNVLECPEWVGKPVLNRGVNSCSIVTAEPGDDVRAKITVGIRGDKLQ